MISYLQEHPSRDAVNVEHGQPGVRPVEGELGVEEESRAWSSRQDGPLYALGHLPVVERSHTVLRGEGVTLPAVQDLSVTRQPGL